MTPYQLGVALRREILAQHQRLGLVDTRRLSGLIGDLCAEDQNDLIPALRHLLMSVAFHSAVDQLQPLSDSTVVERLLVELSQVFSTSICSRMEDLLHGLLNVPVNFTHAEPRNCTSAGFDQAHYVARPSTATTSVATPILSALLALVAGMLLMGLAGVTFWVLHQRQSVVSSPEHLTPAVGHNLNPVARDETSLATPPISNQTSSSSRARESKSPSSISTSIDLAVNSIQVLYQTLSSKDFERSRNFYGAGAADQFDAAFFSQFDRVTVSDLRLTSEVGTTLNLEGVISFIYPDGSLQKETRSFSVDTSTSPAQITSSEFGKVVKPR
jgi:hypothetical protein